MGSGVVAAAAIVSAVAGVASAASSYQQAQKAKKAASEQADLQRQQIKAQAKADALERARAQADQRRQARITAAQFGAQAGAVGGGSVFNAATTGTLTEAERNVSYIEEAGVIQREQYGIAAKQVGVRADVAINEANAAIAQSFANMFGSVAQGAAGVVESGVFK